MASEAHEIQPLSLWPHLLLCQAHPCLRAFASAGTCTLSSLCSGGILAGPLSLTPVPPGLCLHGTEYLSTHRVIYVLRLHILGEPCIK